MSGFKSSAVESAFDLDCSFPDLAALNPRSKAMVRNAHGCECVIVYQLQSSRNFYPLLPQVFSSDAAEPKISLDDDLRRCLVTVGDHLHMYIGGHMVVSVRRC